ncbi:MAG TPA: hypothetical protein VLJ76_04465 [Gaiellaceae bacterium]|nr:hypothetical protein [Gaiellaceae bacterium]
MNSYWGPATLVVGEESFEIKCALDEGQAQPGAPIRGWVTRVSGLMRWGGYFRLLDAAQESDFHAALSKYPTATIRLPDGREAVVSVHEDLIQSADGRWFA